MGSGVGRLGEKSHGHEGGVFRGENGSKTDNTIAAAGNSVGENGPRLLDGLPAVSTARGSKIAEDDVDADDEESDCDANQDDNSRTQRKKLALIVNNGDCATAPESSQQFNAVPCTDHLPQSTHPAGGEEMMRVQQTSNSVPDPAEAVGTETIGDRERTRDSADCQLRLSASRRRITHGRDDKSNSTKTAPSSEFILEMDKTANGLSDYPSDGPARSSTQVSLRERGLKDMTSVHNPQATPTSILRKNSCETRELSHNLQSNASDTNTIDGSDIPSRSPRMGPSLPVSTNINDVDMLSSHEEMEDDLQRISALIRRMHQQGNDPLPGEAGGASVGYYP